MGLAPPRDCPTELCVLRYSGQWQDPALLAGLPRVNSATGNRGSCIKDSGGRNRLCALWRKLSPRSLCSNWTWNLFGPASFKHGPDLPSELHLVAGFPHDSVAGTPGCTRNARG